MFNKSTALVAAAITASLARADLFVQEQLASNFEDGHRDLKAQEEIGDASGIFGLFDADSNGNIQPSEITQAYNQMNTKANDNLKQNELLKAMDGQIRAFCGVGPASEAETQAEQENEDDEEDSDEEQKPRKNRNSRKRNQNQNRGKRGNGRGLRNKNQDVDYEEAGLAMGNQDEFEDEDEANMQAENENEISYEEDQVDYNDESDFEDDGEGGRRLRANRRGNSNRGNKNARQRKNRNTQRNRGGNNKRTQRKNKRGRRAGKVSRKSLAKKRMAKGLFGILDANHNKNLSLKEMFRPFSLADSNYDYNVSLDEFNQFISQAKKPICKQYVMKARKQAVKTWYEMGVPEGESKKNGRN